MLLWVGVSAAMFADCALRSGQVYNTRAVVRDGVSDGAVRLRESIAGGSVKVCSRELPERSAPESTFPPRLPACVLGAEGMSEQLSYVGHTRSVYA